SWKLEAGSWKLEAGSWKLEAGSWKLEGSMLPPNQVSSFFFKLPAYGFQLSAQLPAQPGSSRFQPRSGALPASS
ncbi:MAG: hypothetical protein ACQER5_13535, partial [Pseudomonadota bacterium]